MLVRELTAYPLQARRMSHLSAADRLTRKAQAAHKADLARRSLTSPVTQRDSDFEPRQRPAWS